MVSAPFAPLDAVTVVVHVEEVGFVQEQPRLVVPRPALVHAERGAVAAHVAEVVDVHDLPVLVDLERFQPRHDQARFAGPL